jgi:hemerythrin-like domain-containing protein
MKPSEIRAELLEQHAALRELLAAMSRLASRAQAGEALREELFRSLVRLAERVHDHNAREEELLQNLVTTDAWGAARAQMMTTEHRREHGRFATAIAGALRTDTETAGFGIVALVALVEQHMDREESVFLNEQVLRDDLVVSEQSDG